MVAQQPLPLLVPIKIFHCPEVHSRGRPNFTSIWGTVAAAQYPAQGLLEAKKLKGFGRVPSGDCL